MHACLPCRNYCGLTSATSATGSAALCQLIANLFNQSYRTLALQGQPGSFLYAQTFGDLVTFNPHFHALVADGVFYPSGSFRALPPILQDTLIEALRQVRGCDI